MNEVLAIYKPRGMTPFQVIEKLRMSDDKYKDTKIGYAGRLDPLAHGVMLLTIGDANKERAQYLGLNKTYIFSVLFGVNTDSYDYLGLPDGSSIGLVPLNIEEKIKQFLKNNTGKFSQPYPPFSSKPINGIPLYKLAKSGKIADPDIPHKEVEVYKFDLSKIETIDSPIIEKVMLKNLRKVKGHFRQTKTIKLWKELFSISQNHKFTLATFEVECSSGTYMRSLAHRMGEKFGCGAIAFEIFRTSVGEFNLDEVTRLQV